MALFSLTYASWALVPFSDETLTELLKTCRFHNTENGVTGMLLYREGTFMQTLEGEKATVQALYAKIGRDPRHENLVILSQVPRWEREFQEWSMGFFHLTDEALHRLPGYSEFLNVPLEGRWLLENPSKATELLGMFKGLRSG